MTDFKPGVYRHYKGGLYTVHGLVTHHDTRQPMVFYFSHEHGSFNVRPLKGWSDPDGPVDPDGWSNDVNLNKGLADGHGNPLEPNWVPRFTLVEDTKPDTCPDCGRIQPDWPVHSIGCKSA